MTRGCPVCASPSPIRVLHRAAVPVHQNRLAATREEALRCPRGELDLASCAGCGLVFNRAFDPDLLPYGPGYENDQTASPAFSRHVDERVEALVRGGLREREVLEVGCGTGNFLRRLCRAGDHRGRGFDPAARAGSFDEGRGGRIESRWFGTSDARIAADVVVSRHVLEHAADPVPLLELLRDALSRDVDARVYLEVPALEWILDETAIWDFFYEHASYFSERALRNALARSGLRVTSLERVFAGQYLWAEAARADGPVALEAPPRAENARLERLAGAEAHAIGRWRASVASGRRSGGVVVWGAGAKGATFVHLVDPEAKTIEAVVDVHPRKQGRYVQGTGHAVWSPTAEELRAARTVIVMNPAYRTEIERRLAELGLPADVQVADAP